jgi:hypothetical protein
MAVRQDGGKNHHYWADPRLIAASNTILQGKGSVIRLHADGSDKLRGWVAADHTFRTISRVVPENQQNNTRGETMDIWADCGDSARAVMGAGGDPGLHGHNATGIFNFLGQPTQTTMAAQPEEMKHEILNRTLTVGGTGNAGLTKYQSMSPDQRAGIDERLGINEKAAPGTGQGYAIAWGGRQVHPPGSYTWNFHWAGVLTSSGPDRVVLDNYGVGDRTKENSNWQFQMYGTAIKWQTFHEQMLKGRQFGDDPTTVPVEKR